VRVPHVERWWPDTHGTPKRHAVVLKLGEASIALDDVGFLSIDVERGSDRRGFALRINDALVFCRGACWTSADLVPPTGTPEQN
jgi:beta-mannosidase